MAKNTAPKKKKLPRVDRQSASTASTQAHIPFSEIRDGIVLMKDGSMRAVLLVSSVNFALKSEDEQKGIVSNYVTFLNALDFELQIVIQSRKLSIEAYLEKLRRLAKQQDNELLRKQTIAYQSFVGKLVEDADIMDKKFYVVVPYSPTSKKKKNFWSHFQEVLSPASRVKINQQKFEKYKTELERRVNQVVSGLQSVGLKTTLLDTQALIEVYYNNFNPITKQQRRIEDINKMQVDRTIQ
jgi:hypothetical protein